MDAEDASGADEPRALAGDDAAAEDVREAVRGTRLLDGERPLVVMLSGGRDSVCLLDVAVALRGAEAIRALHVNYSLRAQADGEEAHCRELCDRLSVRIHVIPAPRREPAHAAVLAEPVGPGEPLAGNLHSWARELRYGAARALARDEGAEGAVIATGHTASDQVETILYRLAASPGRRALLGMPASARGVVRPLLGIARSQTAAYCRARGLRWCEDASNDDPRYARARVRRDVVPALRTVHPAAEGNVLRTAELLREEAALLDALVDEELEGRSIIALTRLSELPPALARLIVVRLAERASGAYVPQAGTRVSELLGLGARGGRAELHLGGLVSAVVQGGMLEMVALEPRERSRG